MGGVNVESANLILICDNAQLGEGDSLRVNVLFQQERCSIIVFRYHGEVKAFRNLCVHMPRTLDCESAQVFDAKGGYLRCSMHGIVYSPVTGESLSEICHGKKLTSVRVIEIEQKLYIKDRRVKPYI